MCMERKKILAQEPKNQYDQKKTWNSKSSIANFSRKKQGLYAQEKAIVHVKSLLKPVTKSFLSSSCSLYVACGRSAQLV